MLDWIMPGIRVSQGRIMKCWLDLFLKLKLRKRFKVLNWMVFTLAL